MRPHELWWAIPSETHSMTQRQRPAATIPAPDSKLKLSPTQRSCHTHGEGMFHHQHRIPTWQLSFKMRSHYRQA